MFDPSIPSSSIEACRAICRDHAKSFYLASWALPRNKREAAWIVYAFSRISDDAVDQGGSNARRNFSVWRRQVKTAFSTGRSDDLVLDAFVSVCRVHGISRQLVFDMLGGLALDLTKNRYRSFDELEKYCFKVAAIPGLMMLRVLGCRDKRAEKPASDLGVAMQLTNILRDLKEDAARGKFYLPQDELAVFGFSEASLCSGHADAAFNRLLAFQIERARALYQSAEKGIVFLPRDARLCVRLCSAFYQSILDELSRPGFPVLQRRAVVPLWKKTILAGRELLVSVA